LGARKKTKRRRKKKGQQAPRPTDVVASAEPQLAEGTRSDISAQPTKGMCFATRCHTIDEFVATFHRYCEDSTIFIPDARREVGTSLAFSFELADKQSALLGAGTVVEELSTADNRFGRAGIVVSVKKLKPDSIEVFKRMLAARREAPVENVPEMAHARGRAMTGPIPIGDIRTVRRPTRPLEVHIPSPGERTSTKPRPNLVLGVPVIAKAPLKQPVVQIPGISPRREAKGSRPIPISDAIPHPVFETPDTAVEGDAIPDVEEDTIHDDVPFALRNELRLHEDRAPVRPVVDVDSGWELDEPAPPAAELVAPGEPAASVYSVTAHEAEPEPHGAPELVALPPPPIDAVPIASAWVHSGAATTPDGTAMREAVTPHDQQSTSGSWRRPLRWAAGIAIASGLLAGVMAIAALVEPSTSTPSAEHRAAPDQASESAGGDREQPPTGDEQPPTGDEQPPTGDEQPPTGGEQPLSAPEQSGSAVEQHPFLPHDRRIVPEQSPSPEPPRTAPAPQPNGAAQSTLPSQRRTVPERRSATPERPRAIHAGPPRVTPSRPRPATPKKPCSGLDCL
jgi:hypothetical protein